MIWELIGYSTENRSNGLDIRYRKYTTSDKLAKRFEQIPKLQFTDSGHGIVFYARPYSGSKKEPIFAIEKYVKEQLARIPK